VADAQEVMQEYGVKLVEWDTLPQADAIVFAVAHRDLSARPQFVLKTKLLPRGRVVDVKSCLNKDETSSGGLHVWRL